jgi:hypothetical protein
LPWVFRADPRLDIAHRLYGPGQTGGLHTQAMCLEQSRGVCFDKRTYDQASIVSRQVVIAATRDAISIMSKIYGGLTRLWVETCDSPGAWRSHRSM